MCPLRFILIFLSATLAGFFMLRSLKSQPELTVTGDEEPEQKGEPIPFATKIGSAICSGFWTSVDMASGRYLWRNLTSAAPAESEGKKR